MKIGRLCKVLLTMIFIITISVNASAKTNNKPTESQPLQIPEELDFVFHETCSGHDYFYHVAFREDGWFAVFYRTAINKLHSDEYLSRVYVDIFNDRGEFQKEVSFKTTYDIALKLTKTLNIYFYDYMIAYDWMSDMLQIDRIPKEFAHTSGIYADFSTKELTLGEWSYTCERTLMGYHVIKRTNGKQEEILLSLSGNIPEMNVSLESKVVSIVVCVLVLGIAGIVIIFIFAKRKNIYRTENRTAKRTEQGNNS